MNIDTTDQQAVTVAQEMDETTPGFLIDLASRIHAKATPAMGFDGYDVDRLIEIARSLASVSSASAIKASAEVSLMYLQTGFIECPQCGEEVPTKELDAAYELATVVQPAPTIGGTVRSEPVPATNQAGEVEGAIRIAVWNACRDRGMGQDNATMLVREVLAQPVLTAALATQPATSQEGERLREELFAMTAWKNRLVDAFERSEQRVSELLAWKAEPVPATNQAGEVEDEDKIADMIAFGASESAPYLYPEVDQQQVRAAYCEGAADGARALLRWQSERSAALATQPATSQEGELVRHWNDDRGVYEYITRAATPTPPTLSEDLRAKVCRIETRDVHNGYDTQGNYIWEDYISKSEVLAAIDAALAQESAS
ncbi:hypothetical protein [Sphingomonas sp. Ant20]|uniref:hypothetical protein n=1 Tax=Sphingomonas sp. Ant20 TaxID=104605 RepID=UPI0005385993|nr:hypothetical protein [Sphingomonas sp. Ant20]KHA63405.1 hypothetical protein NI18_15940 [Sphingomonas sp. Ant20]